MAPADKKPLVDQYLALLRAAEEPPYHLLIKSAKDMTKAQARDCYLHYLAWGLFDVKDKYALFAVDASGKLQLPRPEAKVTISPPKIAGVDFKYVTQIDKKGLLKTGKQDIANLDARNVVFLVRLSQALAAMGATRLYHIGFVFPATRTDNHGQGRACDFAGAGGEGWDVTVAAHWTAQPVVMPRDAAGHKKGARLADWPANFKDTTFRLDPSNPFLDQSLKPELARRVFEVVYRVAAAEGTDTRASGFISEIGSGSGFIMHPDHPTSAPGTSNGREAHWQHIHMQIGATGKE
jgi:hypothetical protein